jgi:hypothetical protein
MINKNKNKNNDKNNDNANDRGLAIAMSPGLTHHRKQNLDLGKKVSRK